MRHFVARVIGHRESFVADMPFDDAYAQIEQRLYTR